MGFEMTFTDLDDKQQKLFIELSNKIQAIDARLRDISNQKAAAQAKLNEEESFLNSEKNKIQIQLWDLRRPTIKEV